MTYPLSTKKYAGAFQMSAEGQAIERARNLLVEEYGLAREAIEVERAVPTEFADSSLGCPQKGMVYAPVLLSGYVVTIVSGRSTYEVRVSGDQALICNRAVPARRRDAGLPRTIGEARQDLAARLDVPESAIRVLRTKPSTWADESLGCPVEGETYERHEVEGHVIELVHEGKNYIYHAGGGKLVLCETPAREK